MPQFLKTKAEYDKLHADSLGKLVVIDFTASWCPPCRMIAPKFEQLAKDTPGALFAKVDVDENEETSQEAGIQCMPTFKLYKNGKVIDTLEGANYEELEKLVKKHL